MPSLEVLSGFKLKLDLVHKIVKDTFYQQWENNHLLLDSGHANIPGNERADAAAKSALSLSITNMKLPAYDLIPVSLSFVLKNGRNPQDIWNCCSGNEVHPST